MSLVPVDATNEVSVTTLLERAATWLAEAVHRGEPGDIAAVKAQMATAAEATKQLGLSKDIQLDAQEMVRRAEYALGRAIRRGQEDGKIAKRGDIGSVGAPGVRGFPTGQQRGAHLDHPSQYVGNHAELSDAYLMAAQEPEDFDTALSTAKAEGNLSRSNVVRKVKKQSGAVTRDMRAEMIANLAGQGYSSRQMPAKVGVTEESVRKIARDFDIEIPADRSIAKTRRVDSNRIAANTVTALEGLVMGVELIDYDELDVREASQWADSLTHSIRALNRFVKQIKETAQ